MGDDDLIGEVDDTCLVLDHGIANITLLMDNVLAVEPVGKIGGGVFLEKFFSTDAFREAIHGNESTFDVGKHEVCDGLVVGDKVAFGDSLVDFFVEVGEFDGDVVNGDGLVCLRECGLSFVHFYKDPVVAFGAGEGVGAFEFFSFDVDEEVAFCDGFIEGLDVAVFDCDIDVGSMVPDLDGAGAVFSFGDGAVEGGVVEGVVFGVDGEAFVVGVFGDALGDCPAFEDAFVFKAEVEVESSRVVFLDDEDFVVGGWLGGWCWFWCFGEVAFFAVLFKGHRCGGWQGCFL